MMTVPKKTRDEWRELAKEGMVSAVGEYTPAEFTQLLDTADNLETTLDSALELIHTLLQKLYGKSHNETKNKDR